MITDKKIESDETSENLRAFSARHLNEDIEGIVLYEEIHGKDKVRTLHVALVICLNIGVEPPDLLAKISPCARLEAWYDPAEKTARRGLDTIGKNLQTQYERWQSKARYRQCLDPTIEEVRRICQNLRRSARDERVLFHYNGHGVPRPTDNGEIWVFNKNFTKYIPVSVYDLQSWMDVPSVYVFDCSNAERIIKNMEMCFKKRQEGNPCGNPNGMNSSSTSVTNSTMCMENNIILAACGEEEDIPQNPEVPADLFTACLTTPIKTAVHWYMLKHHKIFPEHLQKSMLDLITGSPSNRLSMFGEINWVFTAVTDTIAWSCLTPDLFQKLFRQDLLVASLFRNFLLAERIMHYYGARVVSYPALPVTHQHPMWDAWDHALDGYICQLPDILHKKECAKEDLKIPEVLPIIRHPEEVITYEEETSEDDDDDIDEEDDIQTPVLNRSQNAEPVTTTTVQQRSTIVPVQQQTNSNALIAQNQAFMNMFNNYDRNMIPRNIVNMNSANTQNRQIILPEKFYEFINAYAATQNRQGVPMAPANLQINTNTMVIDMLRAATQQQQQQQTQNVNNNNTQTNAATLQAIQHLQAAQQQMANYSAQPPNQAATKPLVPSQTYNRGQPTQRRGQAATVQPAPQIRTNPNVSYTRQGSNTGQRSHLDPVNQSNNAVNKNVTQTPAGQNLSEAFSFKQSEFFNDHMTAFELWLKTADNKKPAPIQLPILLQVLLSQIHRFRALRLLSEYMDLGPWAVINCLTVGIFPYVVRLLQSPVSEVKPYLVFIWAKIIASAQTDFAKNDVVKDAGYKYFVSCLTDRESFEIIIKTMATFTLAKMLINNPSAQTLYMNQNFMTHLIEELENNPPQLDNENFIRLRIWFILCFAKLWSNNNDAKWYGVRHNIYFKLFAYLKDIDPEVRASTVYALGTFLNNESKDGVRSFHAIQVDQDVCRNMLTNSVYDSSPLVRVELVVAMSYMVKLFWDPIKSITIMHDEQIRNQELQQSVLISQLQQPTSPLIGKSGNPMDTNKQTKDEFNVGFVPSSSNHRGSINPTGSGKAVRIHNAKTRHGSVDFHALSSNLHRVPSVPNFTPGTMNLSFSNIYNQMYQSLLVLANDPHPKVNQLASIITGCLDDAMKVEPINSEEKISKLFTNDAGHIPISSTPKSGRSPVAQKTNYANSTTLQVRHSAMYPTHKHKVDNAEVPPISNKDVSQVLQDEAVLSALSKVKSDFFNWSCKYFTQPLLAQHRLISVHKQQTTGLIPKPNNTPPAVFGVPPPINIRSIANTAFRPNATAGSAINTPAALNKVHTNNNMFQVKYSKDEIAGKSNKDLSSSHRLPSLPLMLSLSAPDEISPLTSPPTLSSPSTDCADIPGVDIIGDVGINKKWGLMHIEDSAKLEDKINCIVRQKHTLIDGANDWSRCLGTTPGKDASCNLNQVFVQKIDSQPGLVKFHPFLNYLAVADQAGICLWNWESGHKAQYLVSQILGYKERFADSHLDRNRLVTSIEFINPEEERDGLIMVGTMDGKVKIWRHFLKDMGQDPEIVTAWLALTDQMKSHRQSGLVSHWCRNSGQLTLSGDVKYIRLWDSCQEAKVLDIQTGLDSCVTSLDRSPLDGRLVVAGFGDGHVKMFDTRVSSSSCPVAEVGDGGWIQKVGYSDHANSVYSVGIYGEVCRWEVGYSTVVSSNACGFKPGHPPSKRPPGLKLPTKLDRAKTREGLTKTQEPPTSDDASPAPKHHQSSLSKRTNTLGLLNRFNFSPLRLYNPSGIKSAGFNTSGSITTSSPGNAGIANKVVGASTVTSADLRVNSNHTNQHLAIIGYGPQSAGIAPAVPTPSRDFHRTGIATILPYSGIVNSQFQYYEGFSRASIATPTSVCVHPYQNMIGAGMEDCNLILLKLQPK